jgi:hypothetical protein
LLLFFVKEKNVKKKLNNQLIKPLPTFIGIQIQIIKLYTKPIFFQTKMLQIKNIIISILNKVIQLKTKTNELETKALNIETKNIGIKIIFPDPIIKPIDLTTKILQFTTITLQLLTANVKKSCN